MGNHPLRELVIERIAHNWKNAELSNRIKAVDHLTKLYDKFREAKLADPIFEQQLISKNPHIYTQRVAELLLAEMLWNAGFELTSKPEGPDFLATKDGRSVWIELHTPIPNGIPKDYFEFKNEPIIDTVPFEAIKLRWTNAFDEKKRKLVSYINSGLVKPNEPYVIAINSSLLSKFSISGLNGVSGKPVPVEFLFGVGPFQIHIDPDNGKVVDQSYKYSPQFPKPGTSNKIPSDSFLFEQNRGITAVLGLKLLESIGIDGIHHSTMVYNPKALNAIPSNWVPAQEHWACIMGENNYSVTKI